MLTSPQYPTFISIVLKNLLNTLNEEKSFFRNFVAPFFFLYLLNNNYLNKENKTIIKA
jgi:hypothetical protein